MLLIGKRLRHGRFDCEVASKKNLEQVWNTCVNIGSQEDTDVLLYKVGFNICLHEAGF